MAMAAIIILLLSLAARRSSLVLGHLTSCVVCGCCTFCGLTHTTWRSGQWISESPIDHHHFWIVPCSTIRFLWLAKVKPLPSSRNGCLRLCPRHNRRSKPPEPKRSDPNGTSRLFSRSLTSKKNAIRTLPPLCGSTFHRRRMLPPLLGHPAPHQAALRLLHRQLSSRPISLSGNFGHGVQRGRTFSSCPMANV